MNGEFRVSGWRVERNLNRLSKDGRTAQVEPKAMEVLAYLAEHPGEVLSRDSIVRAVWGETHVSDDVLTYCVSELRKALEDDAKNPQIIQTIPRRGYRLIAPVSQAVPATPPRGLTSNPVPARRNRWMYVGATFAILAAVLVTLLWFQPWSPALGESDFILLTDFLNTTGDPVFDDTLKHALAMHLGQSPYLNIYPEERVRETLRYMGRPPDEPVTREIGREICVRRGVKALLAASIAGLGRVYVISLEAISGQTGEVIAREQVEAESKELVLRKLGVAATRLRQKLGESISSVEKFDVPLEQATTASLEAFKAYSTGRKYLLSGRMVEAIPHYRRALEADPNFASAYDDLAWCFDSLADRARAAECARKAFALRDRVSEYERLSIASIYYTMATGELDKAIETLEMMKTIYPRSAPVHNTLGGRYLSAGQYSKAEAAFREAIRLTRHPNAYGGLATVYLRESRYQEAKDVIAEALGQGIDNRILRHTHYVIAFIEGDRATMVQQAQWATGKPEEVFMLALQGNAAAFSGQMNDARRYFRQAVDGARNRDMESAADQFAVNAAWWEASTGNCDRVREWVSMIQPGHDERLLAERSAFALALCGRTDEARSILGRVDEPGKASASPGSAGGPVLRAAIALGSAAPSQALDALGPLLANPKAASLWPRYLAGEAHRRLGAHAEARDHFRYILTHRGADPLSPVLALARLGIARIEATSGDKTASGKSYQELFNLWKYADTDMPILRQALSEYSSLNSRGPSVRSRTAAAR